MFVTGTVLLSSAALAGSLTFLFLVLLGVIV
jgi:hypothetical protein